MFRIDSHQHFWKYNAARDNWITDEMKIIRNDFLPPDLQTEMQRAGVGGCVAVQASQSEEETIFLLSLANEYSFIRGVVGWTDLCADDVEKKLQKYAESKIIKGFRHVLQSEANRALMLTPEFMKGIKKLQLFNFTYDILILPDQLQYLPEFLRQNPEQKFVIDHMAKPDIRHNKIEDWKKQIALAAQYPNVYCKISGLATEADWENWQPDDFTTCLDIVWEAFGANRVMFGSDWPVCLLATQYKQWTEVLENYTSSFSQSEKENFWGKNAALFYNLFDI